MPVSRTLAQITIYSRERVSFSTRLGPINLYSDDATPRVVLVRFPFAGGESASTATTSSRNSFGYGPGIMTSFPLRAETLNARCHQLLHQTRASDAEAVGALLREIHEAILASDTYETPRPGHVNFPDDWLAQNILIHGGLPYLVDLDLWQEWERETALNIACEVFLRDLPHTGDDIAAFRRGYGDF